MFIFAIRSSSAGRILKTRVLASLGSLDLGEANFILLACGRDLSCMGLGLLREVEEKKAETRREIERERETIAPRHALPPLLFSAP